MAADQNILREYLIALGFRVNKNEQNNFEQVVKRTGLSTAFMAKGVVAAATAVVTFRSGIAVSRTGASSANTQRTPNAHERGMRESEPGRRSDCTAQS